VGIVAAPHELVQADDVAGVGVGLSGLADPHPHVLVEVLGGVLGQDVVGPVTDLAGGPGVTDAADVRVEAFEQRRHPGTPGLGEHHLEAGEPLEDAREDQLHQGAFGVERHLVDVEQHRHRVGAVVRVARAAVDVDRHLEVLQHLPQGVVAAVVQRLHPLDVRGDVGQQDAAAQAVLLDPAHVGDRIVDIVEEDLADAGTALGKLVAPIDQPAVVGRHPGMAVAVLLVGRRLGEQHEAGEERRDGVGEHHLGGDAVCLLLGVAHLVVPVAQLPLVAQVLVRVLVLAAPGVKVRNELGVEVLPIGLVAAAGVTVGRNDRVGGGGAACSIGCLGGYRFGECHGANLPWS
jgi:hypothetical protein